MIAVALNAPITEGPILRLPARRDTFLPKRDDIEAYGDEISENRLHLRLYINIFIAANYRAFEKKAE